MSTLLQKVQSGELNPVIYMPMTDAATCHVNYGTGGNFTLNGTIATSNRGANQDNCVASSLAVGKYLISTSTTNFPLTTKLLTVSFSFNQYTLTDSNSTTISFKYNLNNQAFKVVVDGSNKRIIVTGAGHLSFTVQLSPTRPILFHTNHVFTFSLDLNDTAKRFVFLDGIDVTSLVTWTTYTTTGNITIVGNTGSFQAYLGGTWNDTSETPYIGALGEVYFNTTYMDLSVSNPFWDSVENKPVPIKKVLANTGITPLIAIPLEAQSAGKNYGIAGGDFGMVGAPYAGARGLSEYWERTARYNGTGYLSSTGLVGITDSKALTFVVYVYKSASTLYHLIGSTDSNVSISVNASNQLVINAKNSAGATILTAIVTTTILNTTWTSVLVSLDLTNTANRAVYLNGVAASVTWSVYTNDFIDFTTASWVVGADVALANKFNGDMSVLLDNTYIDFSNEVNRLKYIDGLGFPTDVTAKISRGLLSTPALYLTSRDLNNLGVNTGYGGNLTVTATIIQGADVNG